MKINPLMSIINLPPLHEVPELIHLTVQERKILLMTMNDFSCKESADILCIATETVKRHRKNIIRKLQIKGKTEFRRLLYVWIVQSKACIEEVDTVDMRIKVKLLWQLNKYTDKALKQIHA